MFKLSKELMQKIAKKINALKFSNVAINSSNISYCSDCPCQGQCGHTGSSEHYHCPCAANDNGIEN